MLEITWDTLLEQAQSLHVSEIWAVILTSVYVWLAARGQAWCWVFGNIGCAFWAYASFNLYDLWVDALLQVFYIIMGFWGLYRWLYGGQQADELPVTTLPFGQHLRLGLAGLVLTLLFGYFFDEYTPAAATYLDSFTTVFAVIATWLVVQKKLESWLYWIVVDALYVFIYARQGALLFALLLFVWTVFAVFGYFRWRAAWKHALSV